MCGARRDAGDRQHASAEELGDGRQEQGLVRAVPVPDAVVQPEQGPRQHPGVALRDRALVHRVGEEARPGDLERARLLAAREASLLFTVRGALAAEEHLLGDEDAVAQDVVLGELEAVGAERAQRVAGVGVCSP